MGKDLGSPRENSKPEVESIPDAGEETSISGCRPAIEADSQVETAVEAADQILARVGVLPPLAPMSLLKGDIEDEGDGTTRRDQAPITPEVLAALPGPAPSAPAAPEAGQTKAKAKPPITEGDTEDSTEAGLQKAWSAAIIQTASKMQAVTMTPNLVAQTPPTKPSARPAQTARDGRTLAFVRPTPEPPAAQEGGTLQWSPSAIPPPPRPEAPAAAPAAKPLIEESATVNALPLATPSEAEEKIEDSFPRRGPLDEQHVGRYELAFQLASGGFAAVYLARVLGPGGFEKFVALKRIHPHLVEQREFVDMFLDEARIAACINHPNVCPVFDFGEADGVYYLAMDYIFGEPLSRVMRLVGSSSSVLGSDRFIFIAKIVADIADGLHAAHEALGPDGRPLNVVHRDVAPANLFVRYDGHVQIVDFGIAAAAGKLHTTATGVMKGHMAYISPEQFKGQAVDRRTDVWALGVVLWELLTGRRLFKRDSEAQTMYAVVSEPVPNATQIAADVPPELNAVAQIALSRDPKHRFQTARDLSLELHNYLRSKSAPMSPHEVANWVSMLFPEGRARKLRLLDAAREQLRRAKRAPATMRPERLRPSWYPEEKAQRPSRLDALRERILPTLRSARVQLRKVSWRVWAGMALTVCILMLFWLALRSSGSEDLAPAPKPAPKASAAQNPQPPRAATPNAVVEKTRAIFAEGALPAPREGNKAGELKAESTAALANTGYVVLRTRGGNANVYLRGELLGQSPARFRLPVGLQRLKLVPTNGKPMRWVNVRVHRSRAFQIVVDLDRS